MRRRLQRLRRDRAGNTMIEFAIVAPVMLLLIMGLSDILYRAYLHSVLVGAMQKSGRDSTIESNASTSAGSTLDNRVMQQVRTVSPNATYQSSRKSYAQFGQIAPEPYQDNNGNNIYDAATECFTDVNGNRTWDQDPGATGQGGAGDVVVYTMKVQYDRLFPLAAMLGWPQRDEVVSTTILKNQPYRQQTARAPTQVCPT